MPSSPCTPPRRRQSSSLAQSYSNSRPTGGSSPGKHRSKRTSNNSWPSPQSAQQSTFLDDSLGFDESSQLDTATEESNGLGNLADELDEAWNGGDALPHEPEDATPTKDGLQSPDGIDGPRGRPIVEIHQPWSSTSTLDPVVLHHETNDNRSLSPPKRFTRTRHQRKPSAMSDYDGSDYGDASDLETVEGISASLEHRLAAIESLARRGTESNGSEEDNIVIRVAESLGILATQTAVETGASRLATARTAVTSNLAHQTRLMQTLSHHFISPFSLPPSPDEIDELLPLLAISSELFRQAVPSATSALHSLHSSTIDLVTTLSMLTDNLHMMRQTTSLASRRLKASKEAVDEITHEAKLREEGIRWVEGGDWDKKLRNRDCGRICGSVIDGFRETCEWWEKTLENDELGSRPVQVAAG
ncbi:MAG: hypothetical protein Q9174_000420 [Haloplaca sp. 1 TL-2023]